MLNPATTRVRAVKSELKMPVLGVIDDSKDVAAADKNMVTAPRHRGKALGLLPEGYLLTFGNRVGVDRAWFRWLNHGYPERPR